MCDSVYLISFGIPSDGMTLSFQQVFLERSHFRCVRVIVQTLGRAKLSADMMRLRPATAADAELLLEWRNDPDTRKSSIETEKIKKVEHISWLSSVLDSRDRQLLIAEEKGVAVGTIRADLSDGVYQLSWTVARDARGRGLGKQMVAMVARRITAPIGAQVKSDNTSSVLIAEYAGMEFNQELDGLLYFSRPAQK